MNRESDSCIEIITKMLMEQMTPDGIWEGELSSSALSTALAISALAYNKNTNDLHLVKGGAEWLQQNINQDGGYGDTTDSESNISTSIIVWCAMNIIRRIGIASPEEAKLESYLKLTLTTLDPDKISKRILKHYGKDKTFSVPILALCALSGRLGDEPECWRYVPQLPFEFSLLPHSFFAFLKLPVVSYALPALISMGILKHRKKPVFCPCRRAIRKFAEPRAIRKLRMIQPPHGGFLEAVPLTSFVALSLSAAGYDDLDAVRRSLTFIRASARENCSWPIDTNLSTWLTTLSVKAMPDYALSANEKIRIKNWLLGQQFQELHRYTNALPGGWGWTDLPGSTPDADDTSGALAALKLLIPGPPASEELEAVEKGIKWLLQLQNRDGGIPTFCRGWGALPFDRSCPDISAHTLSAFHIWRNDISRVLRKKTDKASERIIAYLAKTQRENGSWIPLWFGNQRNAQKENPVYGTSLVLSALYAVSADFPGVAQYAEKAVAFLRNTQNPDGGWGEGGISTIEETALAVKALAQSGDPKAEEIAKKGIQYIRICVKSGNLPPSPIGLYFASLWYSEKLYPLIFALSAEKSLI